jgi:hypothetical protein
VILEKGNNVDDIILVREGRLRLQKMMTFNTENIYTSNESCVVLGRRKRQWDLDRITKEKEMTVLYISPGKFIGVTEV